MSEPTPQVLWQRAVLLVQQGRSDMAMAELRRLLAIDPDFAPAHALLAQLLARAGDHHAALQEAHAAIASAPDLPFAHYALAQVHFAHEDFEAASVAITRAIELDPADADYHATLAQIRHAQKRFPEALAAADAGLQQEPRHTDCLNLRSLSLVRLGRKQEAVDTLDASLAHDPDNPYTHQARGFALLNQGDAKGALHHFQEALRRDPTLDGARAGLVEALKARNPLYRLVLGWFLWLDRFTKGRQQQILIGAWAVMFVGRRVLGSMDGLEGWAMGLGLCWFGVVLLTSCTVPFFNLLLLLHPLGRHALPRPQRTDALLLGGALLLLGTTFTLYLADSGGWTGYGIFFFLVYLLPVAGIGSVGDGWPRRVLQVFAAGLLAAFGWWAFRLEGLLAQARALGGSWAFAGKAAAAEGLQQALQQHSELFPQFILAAALSTWFVLLAPKRRRRR